MRRDRDGRAASEQASRPGCCPASPLGPSCRSCHALSTFSNDAELGEHRSSLKGAPTVLGGGRPHFCCSGGFSPRDTGLGLTQYGLNKNKLP